MKIVNFRSFLIFAIVFFGYSPFCLSTASGEDIVVKPEGEYAQIDVKTSNEAAITLFFSNDALIKKSVARLVEENLDTYNPCALLGLAAYYIDEEDIEKAALYYRFAMFRAKVDLELAQDYSLGDVLSILHGRMQEHFKTSNFYKTNGLAPYKKALITATPLIIAMDKRIPRNYDYRWACLNSIKAFTGGPIAKLTEEQKNGIIEKERQNFIEASRKDGIVISVE